MAAMYLYIVIISFCIVVKATPYIPQNCTILSIVPCICQDEHGNFVDLRSLASIDFQPAFHDHVDASSEPFKYSWNPCYGFSEGTNNTTCTMDRDTAVCRTPNNGTHHDNIGTQSNVTFGHFDNGNLSLVYRSWDKKSTTIVSLYCDQSNASVFRVVGDMGRGLYWLQLRSPHCCPVQPTPELLSLKQTSTRTHLKSMGSFEPSNTHMQTEVSTLPTQNNAHAQRVDANTVPTMPITMPHPGVFTMTSAPDPSPVIENKLTTIIIVLLGILVVVSFIFAILLARQIATFRCQETSPPKYSKLEERANPHKTLKSTDMFTI